MARSAGCARIIKSRASARMRRRRRLAAKEARAKPGPASRNATGLPAQSRQGIALCLFPQKIVFMILFSLSPQAKLHHDGRCRRKRY